MVALRGGRGKQRVMIYKSRIVGCIVLGGSLITEASLFLSGSLLMNIGIFGVLGVVFVTLKLTENIDWSWWLVLLPFYGGLIIWLVIIVVVSVYYGVKYEIERKRK